MKMYVTMKDIVHDEPYEFGQETLVDAVFSSKEKALERIKLLAEKDSEEWKPKDFDEEDYMNWPLEGSIDSPKENEYRVWIDSENYVRFYIQEVDFNPKEEKEESKPVVACSDNPHDLDYFYWH